jgi:dihydroorotase
MLGLPAIPVAAETVAVARDLALIETSGVAAHFDLISSARAVEMIDEAQRRGLDVSAGVAIHHLHLTEDNIGEFDTQYKVMPPLRSESDRAALREGVAQGIITAISTDHQPHGADVKLAPFIEAATGIAGLETLLPLTLDLVEQKILTLSQAIAAISSQPAEIIGLDVGHLSLGAVADICVFKADEAWVPDEKSFLSRGRNSPFFGQTLKGRATHTIIGGKIAYCATT